MGISSSTLTTQEFFLSVSLLGSVDYALFPNDSIRTSDNYGQRSHVDFPPKTQRQHPIPPRMHTFARAYGSQIDNYVSTCVTSGLFGIWCNISHVGWVVIDNVACLFYQIHDSSSSPLIRSAVWFDLFILVISIPCK